MSEVRYLCKIILPRALEEDIVDFLLAYETQVGFISHEVALHHFEKQGLSVSEQVWGKRLKLCYEIEVESEMLATLKQGLKDQFKGSGVVYYVLPVIEQGVL